MGARTGKGVTNAKVEDSGVGVMGTRDHFPSHSSGAV